MTTQDTSEAILEEMLRDLEKEKPEPSGEGDVVSRGDEDTPVPMIISSVTGRGRKQVYDTKTGEMSWVLYNPDTGGMLRAVLRRKREDGTPMFTLRKPSFEPERGVLKCLLHPDNPNRKEYNKMGLPVCKKDNITASYMVERHMKNRHPSAWAIIDKELKDKEKQEDRDFQRGIVELARGKVESPAKGFTCDDCGRTFTTNIALQGHKRSHSGNKK